jgi:large subunit ribosomal protein L29
MKKRNWVSECRAKTDVELNTDLSSLFREQFKLKLQKASGELKNKSRLMQIRRDIARLKTILSEAKSKERAA